MSHNPLTESQHFALTPLADGVYACIHRPGGGALSNAGIIDLGGCNLVVDAFQTLAAGRALRRAAEALLEQPVETIALTHYHADHWIGASAFGAGTVLLATEPTRQAWLESGARVAADFRNPSEWQNWRAQILEQLQAEQDERVRAGLERSLTHIGYVLAEMAEYQPRYADQTFEGAVTFQGDKRYAELRSFGRGHSADDAVVLLPQDGIAFMGDIGFFHEQPYLGDCDLDLYRRQLLFFQDAGFSVLVPGHGPVGGKEEVALQLRYMDVLEDMVGQAARRGDSFEEALRIPLPEPFDGWLRGGMNRFQVNVRALFARAGGAVPDEE
jgi:cyclase